MPRMWDKVQAHWKTLLESYEKELEWADADRSEMIHAIIAEMRQDGRTIATTTELVRALVARGDYPFERARQCIYALTNKSGHGTRKLS